jgi:ABC-type glycerol-3-phosphate transport system substrate-binding protein
LDNYFTNVFEAAEQQGGLYLLPTYVLPLDAIRVLNLGLFESIGVDAREFESVNIDELLHYYQLIVEANPDRNIVMSDRFSIMYLLNEVTLYDVETLTVNVDTPEMAARFEQAMGMEVGGRVNFTPDDGWTVFAGGGGIGWNNRFFDDSDFVYEADFFHFDDLGLFFGADHPDMRFAPVKKVSPDDGHVRFGDGLTMGIMRGSPNQDLAWEFIRFILEFDENVLNPNDIIFRPDGYPLYTSHQGFPVNRTRFNAQVYEYIYIQHARISSFMNLGAVMDIDGAHRERTVNAAFDFFYDIMSSFNHQSRFIEAVFLSLVYPDIWLLHTGQQTVAQALANIQSRLELYVAE